MSGAHVQSRLPPFLRLRSRGTLIAATILLQAVVLGAGGIVAFRELHATLSAKVERSVVDENSRSLENFHDLLRTRLHEPFLEGTAAWRQAQELVEQFRTPRGTYLVLLDDNDKVLCHPLLASNPNLHNVDLTAQQVRLDDTGEVTPLGRLRPTRMRIGTSDLLAGRASFAVIQDHELKVKILMHQPEAGMIAAAERVTRESLVWASAGGVLLMGITILGSVMLVRKYESQLENSNRTLELEVQRRTKRGLEIRNGLIFGLAKLADYRDTDTGKHLERICTYSAMLGEELRTTFPEIDETWLDRLKLAASMHDIGKVGIPDSILLKPGALTPEERLIMQSHATIGADTLVAIRRHVGDDDLLNMGIQITLSHHERWDGRGYPYGLKGEQIPLAARIVSLADMYDALTSKRVYKDAYDHATACQIILDGRGTQFDTRIIDVFERLQGRFNEIRSQLQSEEPERSHLLHTHEQARVAGQRLAA